jgi:hypothetical protein
MNHYQSLADNRTFVGGPEDSIVLHSNEAAFIHFCREKGGKVVPKGLSGCIMVRLGLPDCPATMAFKAFLIALVERPPRQIPVDADSIDLQDRAEHLSALFAGLVAYLAVVLDDTAQNTPGGLVLTDAEAILTDLAADLTGAIQNAADQMADETLGRVE